MQATTWIDRISDDSNLWLSANKYEDLREFGLAVKFYLNDASDCLARKAPVKAALSCSCAADCLSRVGFRDQARLLYREAALSYLEGAESTGESVRELLWCLREAWIHFQLAGDGDIAEGVLRRFSTLTRRVDPFPGEPVSIQMPRYNMVELDNVDEIPGLKTADLELEVERFVDARRSGRYVAYEPASSTRTAGKELGQPPMRRVLLINWDNYPHFATGGVYTWVKSLVDNAKDWEFIVFNQLSNANANARFEVPKNVKKVIGLPVFGTHRVEEYYPENGPFIAKILRTTDEVIERGFVPLYQRFISGALADECDPKALAQTVRDLQRFLVEHDPKKCFEHGMTWEAFLGQVEKDSLYREMKLSEALLNFQVIQRSMQVLSVRLPKVDIIHSSLAWLPALAGVAAKTESKCPFVITEHGVAFRELLLYYNMFLRDEASKLFWTVFTRNIIRTIYDSADLIVPVCNANRIWEAKIGADESKIRVIYNGIDTGRFRPMNVPRKDRRPTIVSVARISVFKDVIALIQATNYVKDKFPDIMTLVFGEATEQEYSVRCSSMVERLHLEDNFRFMGGTREPEKAYAQADVVAFSSITEAFPFAVIEAMACGKAVVATDVGGVREALEGCGLLVRSRSPYDLANAIVKLLGDPQLRRGLEAAAIARARDKFRIEDSVKQYLAAYDELTAQDHPAAPERRIPVLVSNR